MNFTPLVTGVIYVRQDEAAVPGYTWTLPLVIDAKTASSPFFISITEPAARELMGKLGCFFNSKS